MTLIRPGDAPDRQKWTSGINTKLLDTRGDGAGGVAVGRVACGSLECPTERYSCIVNVGKSVRVTWHIATAWKY